MSSDGPKTRHVLKTSALTDADAIHIRHPFNERSDLFMTRLSDPTGLTHLGVSLARLPAGKESFTLHRHTRQEEWVYVLSGSGEVQLDDEAQPIAAGDFIGFPADGPAHLIRNTSEGDLVYLQGGDRREGDRAHFPGLGKVGFQHGEQHMALVDETKLELVPFSAWLAKD